MIVKLFSWIVTKIKGEQFDIDSAIPGTYVLQIILSKSISYLWGCIRFGLTSRVMAHPSSNIKCISKIKHGKNLQISRRCYIDALSKRGLQFGDNCSLGYQTVISLTGTLTNIGQGMKIGNNVGLGSHGFYGSGMGFVEIGDDCIFGNYVSIHPENHNYKDKTLPIRLQGVSSMGGVKIGNDCWIGAKTTILDGTVIGDHSIVAAGAVVKGVFPDNVIIGGVPARIIKYK